MQNVEHWADILKKKILLKNGMIKMQQMSLTAWKFKSHMTWLGTNCAAVLDPISFIGPYLRAWRNDHYEFMNWKNWVHLPQEKLL